VRRPELRRPPARDGRRRPGPALLLRQARPWEIGKAFEQSAPIGPIRKASGGAPLAAAAIALDVNGAKRQASDVAKLIWSVAEIIEHLSKFWTLKAGDLIFTGTPEGVGPIRSGESCTVSIDGLGDATVTIA